ncbi:hypothetical protein KFE25_008942 [Diacronema lutheri]|uniref:Uncharacterized protein n=1 Tax=Diacronema lutheri TaxID=2081491 RepID=A0A8J5XWV0_DIALT|nr:hypothetical protein KFE25_008942 [Diacronema lutheri]
MAAPWRLRLPAVGAPVARPPVSTLVAEIVQSYRDDAVALEQAICDELALAGGARAARPADAAPPAQLVHTLRALGGAHSAATSAVLEAVLARHALDAIPRAERDVARNVVLSVSAVALLDCAAASAGTTAFVRASSGVALQALEQRALGRFVQLVHEPSDLAFHPLGAAGGRSEAAMLVLLLTTLSRFALRSVSRQLLQLVGACARGELALARRERELLCEAVGALCLEPASEAQLSVGPAADAQLDGSARSAPRSPRAAEQGRALPSASAATVGELVELLRRRRLGVLKHPLAHAACRLLLPLADLAPASRALAVEPLAELRDQPRTEGRPTDWRASAAWSSALGALADLSTAWLKKRKHRHVGARLLACALCAADESLFWKHFALAQDKLVETVVGVEDGVLRTELHVAMRALLGRYLRLVGGADDGGERAHVFALLGQLCVHAALRNHAQTALLLGVRLPSREQPLAAPPARAAAAGGGALAASTPPRARGGVGDSRAPPTPLSALRELGAPGGGASVWEWGWDGAARSVEGVEAELRARAALLAAVGEARPDFFAASIALPCLTSTIPPLDCAAVLLCALAALLGGASLEAEARRAARARALSFVPLLNSTGERWEHPRGARDESADSPARTRAADALRLWLPAIGRALGSAWRRLGLPADRAARGAGATPILPAWLALTVVAPARSTAAAAAAAAAATAAAGPHGATVRRFCLGALLQLVAHCWPAGVERALVCRLLAESALSDQPALADAASRAARAWLERGARARSAASALACALASVCEDADADGLLESDGAARHARALGALRELLEAVARRPALRLSARALAEASVAAVDGLTPRGAAQHEQAVGALHALLAMCAPRGPHGARSASHGPPLPAARMPAVESVVAPVGGAARSSRVSVDGYAYSATFHFEPALRQSLNSSENDSARANGATPLLNGRASVLGHARALLGSAPPHARGAACSEDVSWATCTPPSSPHLPPAKPAPATAGARSPPGSARATLRGLRRLLRAALGHAERARSADGLHDHGGGTTDALQPKACATAAHIVGYALGSCAVGSCAVGGARAGACGGASGADEGEDEGEGEEEGTDDGSHAGTRALDASPPVRAHAPCAEGVTDLAVQRALGHAAWRVAVGRYARLDDERARAVLSRSASSTSARAAPAPVAAAAAAERRRALRGLWAQRAAGVCALARVGCALGGVERGQLRAHVRSLLIAGVLARASSHAPGEAADGGWWVGDDDGDGDGDRTQAEGALAHIEPSAETLELLLAEGCELLAAQTQTHGVRRGDATASSPPPSAAALLAPAACALPNGGAALLSPAWHVAAAPTAGRAASARELEAASRMRARLLALAHLLGIALSALLRGAPAGERARAGASAHGASVAWSSGHARGHASADEEGEEAFEGTQRAGAEGAAPWPADEDGWCEPRPTTNDAAARSSLLGLTRADWRVNPGRAAGDALLAEPRVALLALRYAEAVSNLLAQYGDAAEIRAWAAERGTPAASAGWARPCGGGGGVVGRPGATCAVDATRLGLPALSASLSALVGSVLAPLARAHALRTAIAAGHTDDGVHAQLRRVLDGTWPRAWAVTVGECAAPARTAAPDASARAAAWATLPSREEALADAAWAMAELHAADHGYAPWAADAPVDSPGVRLSWHLLAERQSAHAPALARAGASLLVQLALHAPSEFAAALPAVVFGAQPTAAAAAFDALAISALAQRARERAAEALADTPRPSRSPQQGTPGGHVPLRVGVVQCALWAIARPFAAGTRALAVRICADVAGAPAPLGAAPTPAQLGALRRAARGGDDAPSGASGGASALAAALLVRAHPLGLAAELATEALSRVALWTGSVAFARRRDAALQAHGSLPSPRLACVLRTSPRGRARADGCGAALAAEGAAVAAALRGAGYVHVCVSAAAAAMAVRGEAPDSALVHALCHLAPAARGARNDDDEAGAIAERAAELWSALARPFQTQRLPLAMLLSSSMAPTCADGVADGARHGGVSSRAHARTHGSARVAPSRALGSWAVCSNTPAAPRDPIGGCLAVARVHRAAGAEALFALLALPLLEPPAPAYADERGVRAHGLPGAKSCAHAAENEPVAARSRRACSPLEPPPGRANAGVEAKGARDLSGAAAGGARTPGTSPARPHEHDRHMTLASDARRTGAPLSQRSFPRSSSVALSAAAAMAPSPRERADECAASLLGAIRAAGDNVRAAHREAAASGAGVERARAAAAAARALWCVRTRDCADEGTMARGALQRGDARSIGAAECGDGSWEEDEDAFDDGSDFEHSSYGDASSDDDELHDASAQTEALPVDQPAKSAPIGAVLALDDTTVAAPPSLGAAARDERAAHAIIPPEPGSARGALSSVEQSIAPAVEARAEASAAERAEAVAAVHAHAAAAARAQVDAAIARAATAAAAAERVRASLNDVGVTASSSIALLRAAMNESQKSDAQLRSEAARRRDERLSARALYYLPPIATDNAMRAVLVRGASGGLECGGAHASRALRACADLAMDAGRTWLFKRPALYARLLLAAMHEALCAPTHEQSASAAAVLTALAHVASTPDAGDAPTPVAAGDTQPPPPPASLGRAALAAAAAADARVRAMPGARALEHTALDTLARAAMDLTRTSPPRAGAAVRAALEHTALQMALLPALAHVRATRELETAAVDEAHARAAGQGGDEAGDDQDVGAWDARAALAHELVRALARARPALDAEAAMRRGARARALLQAARTIVAMLRAAAGGAPPRGEVVRSALRWCTCALESARELLALSQPADESPAAPRGEPLTFAAPDARALRTARSVARAHRCAVRACVEVFELRVAAAHATASAAAAPRDGEARAKRWPLPIWAAAARLLAAALEATGATARALARVERAAATESPRSLALKQLATDRQAMAAWIGGRVEALHAELVCGLAADETLRPAVLALRSLWAWTPPLRIAEPCAPSLAAALLLARACDAVLPTATHEHAPALRAVGCARPSAELAAYAARCAASLTGGGAARPLRDAALGLASADGSACDPARCAGAFAICTRQWARCLLLVCAQPAADAAFATVGALVRAADEREHDGEGGRAAVVDQLCHAALELCCALLEDAHGSSAHVHGLAQHVATAPGALALWRALRAAPPHAQRLPGRTAVASEVTRLVLQADQPGLAAFGHPSSALQRIA